MGGFRFMSWNVCWSTSARDRDRQVALVREVAPDVLAVQEVRQPVVRRFGELFAWEVFAVGPVPGDRYWKARQGTAVLGGDRTELVGQELIAPSWFGLPAEANWKANRFSRRATWARVVVEGHPVPVLVGSLHASPGSGDVGGHKPWFHGGVARWLAERDEPWLFGIDANTPGRDHPDHHRNSWGFTAKDGRPGEEELLGVAPLHSGRDLLRDWLGQHPTVLARLVAARPEGPLAVSYHLGKGPVRYDHCWASAEVQVDRIEYLSEGPWHSDHAPVVCDIRLVAAPEAEPVRPPVGPSADRSPEQPVPVPAVSPAGDERPSDQPTVVEELFAELDRARVRDVRGHPTPGRRRQFTAGWNDLAHRDRRYLPDTLQVLTWRNLGYRLAGRTRSEFRDERRRIDDLYDLAAQGYTDGTLRLTSAVSDGT